MKVNVSFPNENLIGISKDFVEKWVIDEIISVFTDMVFFRTGGTCVSMEKEEFKLVFGEII
tara:strand:- start:5233 stop:5415 length:183 start_codon:yes stop_codon:yes gene_type:complete